MIPIVTPALEDYARVHTSAVDDVYERLRAYTFAHVALPQMQVGLLEGQLLKTLVAALGARLVVEVGTFTGYSTLAMAEALPEGGRIITHDVNAETGAIAQRFWGEVPWGSRIVQVLGDARQTLRDLPDGIDMAFIDADKGGYITYWDLLVPKMRRGGLIVADNVLWSGRVLDPEKDDDHSIVRFNAHVRADARVDAVMLTVRDGVTIARKRG